MHLTSKHFELEPLADGVYAAIARPGGLAVSNAGVIDLGDRTLLFDAFWSPQAADDLVDAAERLTSNPVTLAINSHWHPDHVLGNPALPPQVTLISTPRTRQLIAERIPAIIDNYRQQTPQHLQDLETRLKTETDPDAIRHIGEQIDHTRLRMNDLPVLATRLPSVTFEGTLTLQSVHRRANLFTFGGGHTDSDALVYLPDECILFAADLLFSDTHPWLGDGHPDEWLRIYDQIDALDPCCEVVVPGHGPVTTPDAFTALRRYIPALRKIIAKLRQNGGTANDAAAMTIPAAFSAWNKPELFGRNMRYLFEQASNGE